MGEFGDYFKTWNWETGFRYSQERGAGFVDRGGQPDPDCEKRCWIRTRLRRLIHSLAFLVRTVSAARSRVYVTLQNTGEFELPLGYVTVNGDLFNLPAGPSLICDRR